MSLSDAKIRQKLFIGWARSGSARGAYRTPQAPLVGLTEKGRERRRKGKKGGGTGGEEEEKEGEWEGRQTARKYLQPFFLWDVAFLEGSMKKLRFSTNISLYLGNATRCGHSYIVTAKFSTTRSIARPHCDS